ncbi:MAG: nucleoside deaminase [Treponema sp.]|nr:nucleoside deaminase [Treponema sp.]MDY2924092.1 nucleoside deaminase [Treponema sp.]
MNDFMKLAVEEAEKGIASNEGGPFGCVIVKNGEVVGKGHNQVVKNNDPTCHGEMMAIRDACRKTGNFDLSGCELYTTGEPCPMCFGAILWANISKVFYGCNIKDTEKIGFRDRRFYEDSEKIKAELFEENGREECLELYRKYSQRIEKTNY